VITRRTLKRYRRTADEYLRWLGDGSCSLFRSTFPYNPTGPTALEVMCAWESTGTPITDTCEPDILANYVQGKRSRDWHITEWRLGISSGEFCKREFLGTFGLTQDELNAIL
jgi:hypothetical protein